MLPENWLRGLTYAAPRFANCLTGRPCDPRRDGHDPNKPRPSYGAVGSRHAPRIVGALPNRQADEPGDTRHLLGAGPQRQSTFTTSIGSERPLSVALRRPDVRCDSPTVATLATISPAPPRAAMRAASWTPLPWKSPPTCVASEAWRPIRTCGREALRRAVLGESPLDRDRRRHREVRRVEADEEPVAGRRDLLAAVGREHLAQGGVVPAEHRLPGLVAERLDEVRRADDVGEHERLQDPARGTGLAAQLPGQELRDVLEDDGGGRARERGGAEELLVDAVGRRRRRSCRSRPPASRRPSGRG